MDLLWAVKQWPASDSHSWLWPRHSSEFQSDMEPWHAAAVVDLSSVERAMFDTWTVPWRPHVPLFSFLHATQCHHRHCHHHRRQHHHHHHHHHFQKFTSCHANEKYCSVTPSLSQPQEDRILGVNLYSVIVVHLLTCQKDEDSRQTEKTLLLTEVEHSEPFSMHLSSKK